MQENQASSEPGLDLDLVVPKQLVMALCLGALPAFLAWFLDDKALQTWDIPVTAGVLLLGMLFVFKAKPKPLGSLPWKWALLIAAVPPSVAMFGLDGPITNDERSYQLQAELLVQGRIAEPLPKVAASAIPEGASVDPQWDAALMDVFRRRQVYEDPATDRRFSKYAPGTAFGLTFGALFGLPLLSTLLAALLDLALIRLIAKQLRLRAPGLAVLLLGTSPFFLLMHTSMQSEVFTTPAFLAAYLALLKVRAGSLRWAVAIGAASGWVFLTRPLTGLILAAACGLVLVLHAQRLRSLPLAVLGGLPFLVFSMLWNQELTGSYFTPVYSLYAEKYGPFFPGPERLPQDVYGNGDLFAGLLRQAGRWSVAFGGMLGAAALGFWGAFRLRKRDGGAAILLATLVPLAYSLHWYAGHRAYLGPLYAGETLALLCLGLLLLLEQAPVAWRRGLVLAMISCGGVVFVTRWDLIQQESFDRSGPQRVAAAEAEPGVGAVVFLPTKFEGSKEKAFKYWTPSSPEDLQGGDPIILRTTRRLTPQLLVRMLGLEGRRLYGFRPDAELPLGGMLQELDLTDPTQPQVPPSR